MYIDAEYVHHRLLLVTWLVLGLILLEGNSFIARDFDGQLLNRLEIVKASDLDSPLDLILANLHVDQPEAAVLRVLHDQRVRIQVELVPEIGENIFMHHICHRVGEQFCPVIGIEQGD